MSKSDELQQWKNKIEQAVTELPLVSQATDIIPGEGNPEAQVLFIGEAPGYYEHVQRRPFVGRSGQLLRSTLTQLGIPPESVYISNIVKARPPDNRDPTPEEITAYKPWLDREIAIIKPLLIATLGRFSMAKFLPSAFISQVHGRLHKVTWNGQQQYVLPLYHPAAALRSTSVKEAFIHDLEKIPKIVTWVEQQLESQKEVKQMMQVLL